jgi:hypothetical protein
MTIKTKTIRVNAETSIEEFNDVKDFLSRLDDGYYFPVSNYVIAYVLVRKHGYKATKINNVYIDNDTSTVTIDFESEYHKEEEDIEK